MAGIEHSASARAARPACRSGAAARRSRPAPARPCTPAMGRRPPRSSAPKTSLDGRLGSGSIAPISQSLEQRGVDRLAPKRGHGPVVAGRGRVRGDDRAVPGRARGVLGGQGQLVGLPRLPDPELARAPPAGAARRRRARTPRPPPRPHAPPTSCSVGLLACRLLARAHDVAPPWGGRFVARGLGAPRAMVERCSTGAWLGPPARRQPHMRRKSAGLTCVGRCMKRRRLRSPPDARRSSSPRRRLSC